MAQGLPPGGAACPERHALANRSVGNPPSAPAIEYYGELTIAARGGAVSLSADGELLILAEGQALQIPGPITRRVGYLALAGGIDVPSVLGGRGTLTIASLGGFAGRALRRGDLLPLLPHEARQAAALPLPPLGATLTRKVRVVPGPDLERFSERALELLFGATFRISPVSDRIGTRLQGPTLERLGDDAAISMPMVRGAIQVAAGGSPIVFGPDHPTTGGYPVIATVIRADWGKIEERPPHAKVHFEAVSAEQAREAFRQESLPWVR